MNKLHLNGIFLIVFLFLWAFTDPPLAHADNFSADRKLSFKEQNKKAQQGDAEGQFWLGVRYYNGLGVPRDYKEAVKWYRRSADQGHAKAQFNLGVNYEIGRGVTQNYKKAVKWYQLSAEQGIKRAQFNLGVEYYQGQGVPQNYKEAVKWLSRAAEQGDVKAQFYLGIMYEKGQGVPPDFKESVKWYRKAAEQGHSEAQYYLGTKYYNGQGVPHDDKEAVKWYRLAVAQGLAIAQLGLGEMYANGRGVKQDYKEATKWYRKAAEQGDDSVKEVLGQIYFTGQGVRKNYVSAYMWFNLAEIAGQKSASDQKDVVAGRMTDSQITEAQEMTQQWVANNKRIGKTSEFQRLVIAAPAKPALTPPSAVPQKKLLIHTAGTGFSFGSSGYILTNFHVVKDAKYIKVRFLNGDVAEAKIIIKDESNDIAFLKPERSPKLPGANISLGDSSAMRIGDKVFTIGFPMSNILGHQPGYSEGVINSLAGVGDDPRTFRISIPIQSGNSGGPLFSQKGEVVGIVSSSLDSANTFQVFGNTPQNVNFAVKSTFVKNLLPMIPDALISPTDIVVVPKDSGSLSSFIERVQNNIVLIEAEY